jgi:hypothetical protein
MYLGRVPRISGLALRRTGGISGEGVGCLIVPPRNEPQLKPPQRSGCVAQGRQGVGATPILPEVNECRAIGVHTQVACTPGDRRLHRRQNWREGFL